VKATFLVVSYATSSGHKYEDFTLQETDGFTARHAHWTVEHKSFGRRNVQPIPGSADPTAELAPWDDSFFLSDAAFELRENRGKAE
jgi:hypothetical protein